MKIKNIFFTLIFFLRFCFPLFSESSSQKEDFVDDKNESIEKSDDEKLKIEDDIIKPLNENEKNAEELEISEKNLESDFVENKEFEISEENIGLSENQEQSDSSYVPVFDYLSSDYKFEPVEIPEKKRPKKPDLQKVQEAESKDDSENSFSETEKIIKYGTSSEISDVINKIVENDDPRFTEILYDLFQVSKNVDIRSKILEYFTKQKDDCLADYALEILNDPYDYPNKTVENVFRYVSEIELKKACPCIVEILEVGNENYFNAAISVIGKIGGPDEAVYMASYLERDDLILAQRQSLMKTLGQMCAVETWEKLVEIVKDEDENSFVRMYAAEAIGKMKKEESVPILIEHFESSDPNMRQYCLKGLENFPDNPEAVNLVLQATRDEYYKVRIEAIKACKELNLKEALPYLIYRAEKDVEKSVQKECYPVIAFLNINEGNDFLIKRITEKKVSDTDKLLAASALIENGNIGEDEILLLAKEVLNDNRRKNLRNELGKLFIKYAKPSYSDICAAYLQSDDVTTVSQGLEMYKKGQFESAKGSVMKVAEESKNSSNKKRARKILGLKDEDDSSEKKENSSSGAKESSSASDAK